MGKNKRRDDFEGFAVDDDEDGEEGSTDRNEALEMTNRLNPGSTVQTVNVNTPGAGSSPTTNPFGYPVPQQFQAAPQPDDWGRWSNYILLEIKRLNDCLSAQATEIQKVQIEVAKLAVKASIWGALAGILASLAAVMFKSL